MKILEWRKKENKTQTQVAADLGVDQSTVQKWEVGIKIPTFENMQKITAYTCGEVTANDFYEVTNENNS